MAQGVSEQGQEGGQNLCRDVPSTFRHLSDERLLSVPAFAYCLVLLVLSVCCDACTGASTSPGFSGARSM